jgi:hypothetical protein
MSQVTIICCDFEGCESTSNKRYHYNCGHDLCEVHAKKGTCQECIRQAGKRVKGR